MRHGKNISALVGIVAMLTSHVVAQSQFVVARQGKQVAVIALLHETPLLKDAASELQFWLHEVSGAKLPIVTVNPKQLTSANQPLIVLATAEDVPEFARKERLTDLNPEGFVIKSDGSKLWLVGNTDLAVRHAVFALLEGLGCRWLMPDPIWTVVPSHKDIIVKMYRREEPAFSYRRIWYGWGPRTPKLQADYEAWMKRNRQHGYFPVNCGHAYEVYVPRSLFKEHPEWFALVNGKRQPTQICVTNPEVQKRVIDGVLSLFRQNPNLNMASVEPNDGGGYCECENCSKLGSVSNQVFLLANLVAKAVRREFPEKWVGLYAYAYHSDPPDFPIERGVYVQVTTGFRYTKLTFEEQVNAFRKLGAGVGVYDYFSVYPWDFDLPGAAKAGRVYELAEAIRHYWRLGATTYDAESSCNWGPNGLGYWVAAKLMWNPNQNVKALVRDFCNSAFGKAAGPMRKIYERWAKGERFSARSLRLAFDDLQEAFQRADDPKIRARINRIAMYLHLLRLWLDYERTARWNQWNKLVAKPEEILPKAREVIVFARRIMDTGLVHTFPMLFSEWFEARFAALKLIEGLDWRQVEAWKSEQTDIPTEEEMHRLFTEDVKWVRALVPLAVEIEGRKFSEKLVPITKAMPEAVKAWGDVRRSPLFVETGVYYFIGKRGERVQLTYLPYPDPPHTVDCRWTLRKITGESVAQGKVKAEKGKKAVVEVVLPEDGLYVLDPGTDYWRAACIEMGERPQSVWCGRGDEPSKPHRKGLRLWLPNLNEPLYFFVPKGTKHFVIGIVSGGDPFVTIELRTADGTVIRREKLVAGDQISVIVEQDIREYGEISEIAKHAVLPSEQLSIVVPKGKDGQIWSLSISGLRCLVELYDVPPFISRHPSELLVPAEAISKRR